MPDKHENEPHRQDKQEKKPGRLDKLKEYKELIAIIVFFLGGFFWLNAQFPTKDDLRKELSILSCLVDNYMELTQLQMSCEQLDETSKEMKNQICSFQGKSDSIKLTPAMQFEFDKLKSEYKQTREEYQESRKEIDIILKKLQRNACGGSK